MRLDPDSPQNSTGAVSTATAVRGARAAAALCVDLDGTLLKTDLLWECVLRLLKIHPMRLFLLLLCVLKGRPWLKHKLAEAVTINPATLPVRGEVLDFVREQRSQGRYIALVTAANERLALAVADHFQIFDAVYATGEGGPNLKGQCKRDLLQANFPEGYEYIGNSTADMLAWQGSRIAHVVGSPSLVHKVESQAKIGRVFTAKPASLRAWVRALRGHHWAKNLLVFVPLLLAHNLHWIPFLRASIAFVLLGLCASAIYIVNDLLDLHSDREHPWKSTRPFASGEVPIPAGLVVSFLLITAAMAASFVFEVQFGIVLLIYSILTMLYSLYLKRLVLIDVFVLSGFYTIRIWAGAAATSVPLSQWFLGFSTFFFFSLATAKRYSELMHATDLVRQGNSGRGYRESDRDFVSMMGIASAFSAVLILSLYVHSPEVLVLYGRPERLLLLCPVILYWLSRVWLKAHRGELHEDPVTLAFRDPASYVTGAAALLIVAVSLMKTG